MRPDTSSESAASLVDHYSVRVSVGLDHHEIRTPAGLLSLLWHHADSPNVVVTCSGARGGLLGPARGLYHELGERLARSGLAEVIRIGWRQANHLSLCTDDVLTTLALAARGGARNAAIIGHSFGGAPAIQAALATPGLVRGVATLATQSTGCELAHQLGDVDLLCIHGGADAVVPIRASEMVARTGGGRLVIIDGAGHSLEECVVEVRGLLDQWLTEVFDAPRLGRWRCEE